MNITLMGMGIHSDSHRLIFNENGYLLFEESYSHDNRNSLSPILMRTILMYFIVYDESKYPFPREWIPILMKIILIVHQHI